MRYAQGVEAKPDPLCAAVAELYREFGIEGVTPKWAFISEDCRPPEECGPGGSLSNQPALYLGNFTFPDPLAFRAPDDADSESRAAEEARRLHDALCVQPDEYPDDEEFEFANPLLVSETGEVIWGLQCYWGEVAFEETGLSERFGFGAAIEASFEELKSRFRQSALCGRIRGLLEHAHRERSP